MGNINITENIRNYQIYNRNLQGAQKAPLEFCSAAAKKCIDGLLGLNFVIEDKSAKPGEPASIGGRYV